MSRKYKFHEKNGAYFISFATVNWIDVFTRDIYFSAIIESLYYCRKNKGMEIYGYCIMPSHIHLIFRSSLGNPSGLINNDQTIFRTRIKCINYSLFEKRTSETLALEGAKSSLKISYVKANYHKHKFLKYYLGFSYFRAEGLKNKAIVVFYFLYLNFTFDISNLSNKISMKSKLLFILLFFTFIVKAQCWQKISAGNYFTAAIKSDGTLWTWGDHQYGQLGIGAVTTDASAPVQVGTSNDWSFVFAGWYSVFAIKTNGTLWAWGQNTYG